MSSGYLYRRSSPATPKELAELLQKLPRTPAWRLQEQTDALEFEQADAAWLAALPAGLWPQGQVFGPQAEVRWWTADDGSYEVLVLCETRPGFLDKGWQEQPMEVGEEYRLYLWGKRQADDPYWIETRISRPLRYPLDEAEWQQQKLPYIAVVARDYVQNGVVRLTRLVRLEPTDVSRGGSDG